MSHHELEDTCEFLSYKVWFLKLRKHEWASTGRPLQDRKWKQSLTANESMSPSLASVTINTAFKSDESTFFKK